MAYSSSSRHSLLTAEEEIALAREIEAGTNAAERIDAGLEQDGDHGLIERGEAARHRFMEANLRLVLSIASKVRIPAHVDREDVVQDGLLGLEKAVGKFDWRKGYKFSTYATWWIRQGIQRGLEYTASTVRIPAHRSSELRMALSEHDGDTSRLSPKLSALAALSSVDSIDRPIGESTTVLDVTAADEESPEAAFLVADDRRVAHELLAELDPVTAYAVGARFGIDGNEPATFRAIGSQLGVSPEAARRRISRALDTLRAHSEGGVKAPATASTERHTPERAA